MTRKIDLEMLLEGCSDTSFDSGIRIHTELEPLSGPGGLVKPAVHAGGVYQEDRRWAGTDDDDPTPVIVIDNVPSQANRLEDALLRSRESSGVPELELDLSTLDHLPSHLPRRISSLQFPHRNADAYLRDAMMDGEDFLKTDLGKGLFGATAWTCGPLMAWFPQALLYGFWQSHLGRKRAQSKHARAWVSEIVGWRPATTETKVRGLKGDPLNLNIDNGVHFDPGNQTTWDVGQGSGGKDGKLSEIGHGQVPFKDAEMAPSGVSFTRITQQATVSLAHLRRVSLGDRRPDADAAARALLVALGLHAHNLAFGRGFVLRSGAELEPRSTTAVWLGRGDDEACEFGGSGETGELLQEAIELAGTRDVPLDGWGQSVTLSPKPRLKEVIEKTWPRLDD